MLTRTGFVRSRKSCCSHEWTSPRRKLDSPSVLTRRVSAKRIWKYELPLVPCASPASGQSHQIKRKERPSIPNGAPNTSSVCSYRLRLIQYCTRDRERRLGRNQIAEGGPEQESSPR